MTPKTRPRVALCAFLATTVAFSACTDSGSRGPATGLPFEVGDAAIRLTSPFDGEDQVAITRESVVRFDAPVDPDTVDDESIFASVDDRKLPARVHVAADRLSATLFYSERLPADAEVVLTVDGNRIGGTNGRALDADGDHMTGGIRNVRFTTLDLTRVPNTDVCGRVLASELADGRNVPIAGVVVTVDGLEDELRATTDALGNFCLRDVPAGRVFVHVDGSNAASAPLGFSFPSVGKAWDTRGGERVNVDTVYLPVVAEGAFVATSSSADTPVRMSDEQLARFGDPAMQDALRNVVVTIPPDNLFANDGTRGGSVAIAPVVPSRLPGPLPDTLTGPTGFRVVITVQTSAGAANFDRPVPVCMPNIADPNTGFVLPPGAKTALWSFDHDAGRWDAVGTMTVSEDGVFICSDPGSGIRAPGWHGTAPGTSANGGPASEGPPCPDCCDLTIWDISRRVLDAGAEAAECAGRLFLQTRRLSCLIRAALSAKDLRDFSRSTDQYLDDMTVSRLEQAKVDLNSLLNTLEGLIDCGAGLTIGLLREIAACLDNLLTLAQSWCDADPECTTVVGQSLACGLVARITPYTRQARLAIEQFDRTTGENLQGTLAQGRALHARICAIIADRRAGAGGSALSVAAPEGGTSGEIPLTMDDLIELRDAFAQLAARGPTDEEVDTFVAALTSVGDELAPTLAADMASTAAFVQSLGSPVERTVSYVLTRQLDGTILRRGTSSGRGVVRALLPEAEWYELRIYDPDQRQFGRAAGVTSGSGQITELNMPALGATSSLPDSDLDGLVDAAEFVFGTDAGIADTDADGVSDGDEVHAGTDPLDGVGGSVRVVSEVDTLAPALDVCAAEGLVAVAIGDAGVQVFNAFNGLEPIEIARLDTAGTARRVASAGAQVAIADGNGGLAVADLSDPSNPVIAHQVSSLGDVRAVAAQGRIAFSGSTSGTVGVVDMQSGVEIARGSFGFGVVDLAVRGDTIYALGDNSLSVLRVSGGVLVRVHDVALSRNNAVRLFLGDTTLVVTHWRGFVTLDVTDVDLPVEIAQTDTSQLGWRQMVLDGSGFGVGVVGPNTGAGSGDDVHLYRVDDASQPGTFVRDFASDILTASTPSSAVVFNGLAYVGDRQNKLRVLRYVIRDLGSSPPQVALTLVPDSDTIEEGATALVRARVSDDVQACHVDFFVDGQRVVSDGTFPFETSITAPGLVERSQLELTARAVDTAGNAATSETRTLLVTEDITPPEILRSRPADGGVTPAGAALDVVVTFSERVNAASIGTGSLQVVAAGLDGAFDTGDDVIVSVGSASYEPQLQTAIWSTAGPLEEGMHRVTLSGIADVAGNTTQVVSWTVRAIEGARFTAYRSTSSTNLREFFAGRTPDSFNVQQPSGPAIAMTETVVPNGNFVTTNAGWFANAGADDVYETSNLNQPVGDDIVIRLPGASSGGGMLLEGSLRIEQTGTYTFSIVIDDRGVLEIDGVVIIDKSGGCNPPRRFAATPIELEAGVVTFRFAASDACGGVFAARLEGAGPGLPGGVIPSAFFGR